MSVTFEILKDLGLVYVRYEGFADLASTLENAQACTTHPDFHPGIPHYFDLSGATGYEMDFAQFFQLQAQLADVYLPDGVEHLGVFHAPDGPPREMAELARRSWADVPQMVLRIVETQAQALAILGLTEDDLAKHTRPETL